MQSSANHKPVSRAAQVNGAAVRAAAPAGGAPLGAEAWVPVEGAWSQSAPWQDTSLRSRWVGIVGGVSLGFLAILAFAGALARQFGSSQVACTTGAECNRLGALYAEGAQGTAQDPALAARLFQRACDLGQAGGCNNLGLQFESGNAVPQDYGRAMSLFERACSGGFAEGCNNQGALYEHGLGVPVNLGDAQRLYAQACNRGSALGCSNLGVLYAEGRGVARDPLEAARLFGEACSGGSAVGCNNLLEAEQRPLPAR